MTRVTIESDSEEITQQFLELAQKLGVPARTEQHRVLTDDDVVFGFGRKATEAELTEYLLATEEDDESTYISIEELRAKFSNR